MEGIFLDLGEGGSRDRGRWSTIRRCELRVLWKTLQMYRLWRVRVVGKHSLRRRRAKDPNIAFSLEKEELIYGGPLTYFAA